MIKTKRNETKRFDEKRWHGRRTRRRRLACHEQGHPALPAEGVRRRYGDGSYSATRTSCPAPARLQRPAARSAPCGGGATEGFRLLGGFGALAWPRSGRGCRTRSLLLSRTHHPHRHHTGGVFLARLHGQRTQRRARCRWVQWKERWTAAARRSEVRAAETRSQLLEGAHQKRSQRLGAQRAIACRLLYVRGALSRALRLWSEGCVAAGHEERQRAAASVAAAEGTLRADRLRAKVAAALPFHRFTSSASGRSRTSSLSLSRSRVRLGVGNAEDDEEDEAAEDDDEEKGAGGAADENGETTSRTTSTTSSTSNSTTADDAAAADVATFAVAAGSPSSASSSTLPDAVRQRLGRRGCTGRACRWSGRRRSGFGWRCRRWRWHGCTRRHWSTSGPRWSRCASGVGCEAPGRSFRVVGAPAQRTAGDTPRAGADEARPGLRA